MEERAEKGVATLHMSATAALSIAALLAVAGWQLIAHFTSGRPSYTLAVQSTASQEGTSTSSDALAQLARSVSSSTDPIAAVSASALSRVIGAYEGLQMQGGSAPQVGTQIASSIGSSLSAPVSFRTFSIDDMATTSDTSYDGMLAYRAHLQKSLKPLLDNQDNELNLFAEYVQTGATSSLNRLSAAADNYLAAASSTARVVVPEDAVLVQLNLVNSLEQFAATLKSMVMHASDPIASAMLLQNYDSAQAGVLASFQALVQYEKGKQQ